MSDFAHFEYAFVGRQPIYNDKMEVVGYELLFRTGDTLDSLFKNAHGATIDVAVNAFVELGIEQVAGNKAVHINVTPEYFFNPIPLPANRVVLEFTQQADIEAKHVPYIKQLKSDGYKLAIDNYKMGTHFDKYVELFDILKVNVARRTEWELRNIAKKYPADKFEICGAKIETLEQFNLCKELKFKTFQGYYFARPKVLQGKKVGANELVTLQVISQMQNPDVTYEQLEEIIRKDPILTFKLLKIVNSAVYCLPRTIESIHEALSILGMDALREWVTILVLSSNEVPAKELISMSLHRAKMAETIAKDLGRKRESYFLMGLFSLIDIIYSEEMPKLLKEINVTKEIYNALVNKSGEMGQVLAEIISYEKHLSNEAAHHEGVDTDSFPHVEAYRSALAWANQVMKFL